MTDQDFGANEHHTKHFTIISITILVAAIASLYVLNLFGYFGIFPVSGEFTEEACIKLLYPQVSENTGFVEFADGNKTVKQTIIFDNFRAIQIKIETEGNSVRCYSKHRSNESAFLVKGFGQTEYGCTGANILYSGRSENNYYAIIKETQLADTIATTSGKRPQLTGIPELDSQIKNLPEDISGELDLSVSGDKFIDEIVFTNDKNIHEKELNILRGRYCPNIFEILR